MRAPATAPAKPSTGLGTEFGGRAVGWPMAWAKAAQSGVKTVRWVQPLVSSFSRTKFACTWRDRWVLYGCNSRGDATSGDRDGRARPWGVLSLLVFLLQAPVSTIKGFPFLLMRYWFQAGCWELISPSRLDVASTATAGAIQLAGAGAFAELPALTLPG